MNYVIVDFEMNPVADEYTEERNLIDKDEDWETVLIQRKQSRMKR